MAEPSFLFSPRSYYQDARTPIRRMGVSAHPDQGLVILSLWQGRHCTGTFQLPVEEAPPLIAELAHALGAAIPISSPLIRPSSPGATRLVTRLLERLRVKTSR